MKTIKINDTGIEVVILQHILGLTTDGIFGQQTDNALRMYQSHNRLEVDGICGNKTWNALLGYDLKRSARQINEIIIHCSATPEGKDVSVEEIRQYHKKVRGWKDIGYHYVIYLDGSVHNGRDADWSGAHTTNHNQRSIGICYIGGCKGNTNQPKDTRTPAQKKAMDELVYIMRQLYPNATVHGHNEFAAKACPCFDVKKEYRQ